MQQSKKDDRDERARAAAAAIRDDWPEPSGLGGPRPRRRRSCRFGRARLHMRWSRASYRDARSARIQLGTSRSVRMPPVRRDHTSPLNLLGAPDHRAQALDTSLVL